MDNRKKLDRELLEAIDACRPGSEDLSLAELSRLKEGMASDPELRTVFERLEDTDIALAEAFHDVSVPDGLADRITSRLAEADETVDTSGDEPLPAVGRPGRRGWFIGAGLAAAASVIVAMGLWPAPEVSLTAEAVEQAGITFFDEEGDAAPAGDSITDVSPPRSYPIGTFVVQAPEIRWRWIKDFLGRKGVAYDLPVSDGSRATLYVVKPSVPALPTGPPPTPASNTRSRVAAAWQANGLLYVLVVDGEAGKYREVLGMSSRPYA